MSASTRTEEIAFCSSTLGGVATLTILKSLNLQLRVSLTSPCDYLKNLWTTSSNLNIYAKNWASALTLGVTIV